MASHNPLLVIITRKSRGSSREKAIRKAFSKTNCSIHTLDNVNPCNKTVNSAFALSLEINPEASIIVISDRVSTYASPKKIAKSVDIMLSLQDQFDLFFLTRSMDHCQKSKRVREYDDYSILTTYYPRGTDAVFYTPEARDKLLDVKGKKSSFSKRLAKEVARGNLKALTFEPNLFDYYFPGNDSKTKYYKKRMTCAPIQTNPAPVSGLGTTGLIVLIAVIIVILITAWALIRVGPEC